jgi:hypothetical protein
MFKVNAANKGNIFRLMKDKHTKRTVLTDIYFHLNDTDKIHYMYISQQKTFCRVNTHYQSSIARFVSTSQIASFYTFLTNSHVLDPRYKQLMGRKNIAVVALGKNSRTCSTLRDKILLDSIEVKMRDQKLKMSAHKK